ncbi:MAG: dienelactone hydrolase family protein [Candidatus Hydrogenedentes bacterium]|nr:dienelactone hydrolase family protein [Candidatus Hydrogenedentota bacterium]
MTLPMIAIVLSQLVHGAVAVEPLPGTAPLTITGEPVEAMVAGIDAHLMQLIDASVANREEYWQRDFSSPDAYAQSVEPNRQRFARIIGAHEEREAGPMELVATTDSPALIAESAVYRVYAVRWRVLREVYGEGLLIEPKEKAVASVVALPDCDWSPEALLGLVEDVPADAQFARRLAESGCRVIVPTLLDRRDTYSGNPDIRMTNQPHREFAYRAAYELGRHIIGYEVQKARAAIDWFEAERGDAPIGVIGSGEGGLIAFYTAAVDTRVDAAVVSGYFKPRSDVWSEPIYRNVWSLLHEFGDAEIASLIAPRTLIVEACDHPQIDGPPEPSSGRTGAAPGRISTPSFEAVQGEVDRAHELVGNLNASGAIQLTGNGSGLPGSDDGLSSFMSAIGGALRNGDQPKIVAALPDAEARMKRQVDQLINDTQHLMRTSQKVRDEFWKRADYASAEAWAESAKWYRDYFSREVIGELPPASVPINPRTRLVFDEPAYRGYEVQLDVYPDVFAFGILLVPKNIPEGERRPVVVCQHGLEGYAREVADPSIQSDYYHQFACKLAEQGFVTYASQNPYVGGDAFRVLQRKANPLELSLFSFIVRQHERTLEWLGQQPFVDPERIAFYGLSYGGKTAMRVPAILEGYCLSICSGDFNEWIKKNVTVDYPLSYMFTGEYEMFEWDLGSTFDYGEMAALIFPRPFMVERGHRDGVSYDEWVAHEYAKVRRMYDELGLGDRTTIEYFNGPHTIHGVGTFEFLREQLDF